jgi:hypothetical protein
VTYVEHRIDFSNQSVPFTLEFLIEAEGDPDRGWRVKSATLTDVVFWFDPERGESVFDSLLDLTPWFKQVVFSSSHLWRVLSSRLDAQWSRDAELEVVSE